VFTLYTSVELTDVNLTRERRRGVEMSPDGAPILTRQKGVCMREPLAVEEGYVTDGGCDLERFVKLLGQVLLRILIVEPDGGVGRRTHTVEPRGVYTFLVGELLYLSAPVTSVFETQEVLASALELSVRHVRDVRTATHKPTGASVRQRRFRHLLTLPRIRLLFPYHNHKDGSVTVRTVNEATRYRLIYLAYFAALSGFGTFRNIFLEDIGMTGVQMGIIGATITVAATAAQPVWGLVTDWKGAQREVLVVAAAVTAVAVLAYPLAPRFEATFAVLFAGTVVYAVFYAPISPITDSLVLSTGVEYGRVRAFGSIAFGLGSLGYGFLIAELGSGVIFYVYSLGMAALVVAAWGVPSRDANTVGVVGRDAVRLVTDREFLLLLASASLVGFTLLSGNDFFSVYVREIGGSDTTTGVAWFVLTVVEAIGFVYLFRLTSRYRYLLALGGFAYAVKYAVYYLVSSPGVVVVSHLVTGVSFAAFYLAAVSLADSLAPDSLSSTAQTLVWSATFGAGAGAGQLVAGALVDSVGVSSMYGVLALIAAAGGAVALLIRTEHGDATGGDEAALRSR